MFSDFVLLDTFLSVFLICHNPVLNSCRFAKLVCFVLLDSLISAIMYHLLILGLFLFSCRCFLINHLSADIEQMFSVIASYSDVSVIPVFDIDHVGGKYK